VYLSPARMTESRKKQGTVPGFEPLREPLGPMQVAPLGSYDEELTTVEPVGASPEVVGSVRTVGGPASAAGASKRTATPAVDIDLVYERRSAPLADQPWVFVEIWTRNTVYHLDGRLVCIDVVDQASRKSQGDHPLRGARLVGGQSRDGESIELSHPFPRPGSEAVFEQTAGRHVRFSQTSSVTRVVMRLRVLSVTPEQLLPTWEEVTGNHKAEALKKR
jgi:hypothetical protein